MNSIFKTGTIFKTWMRINRNIKIQSHKNPIFSRILLAASLCFLSSVIAWSAFSGSYTTLTTPRAFMYLILASIMLVLLAFCAIFGVCKVSPSESLRILVAILIPALLIVIPLQNQDSMNSGFDKYAGGRAIAIKSFQNYKNPRGLDSKNRVITISDDDFGAWYDEIDHNLERYKGYEVIVNGFISKSNSLTSKQFYVARHLMSCCILDMSPFGFVGELSDAASSKKYSSQIKEHQWVRVHARIDVGKIGKQENQRMGVILKIYKMSEVDPPIGYFYRP